MHGSGGACRGVEISLFPPRIGLNVPWLGGAYGHDLGRNRAHPDWPVWYNCTELNQILDLVQAFGIRLLRIWLFENGEGLQENAQIGGVDELFLRNLDELVGNLGQRGLEVYWTLLDANSVLPQWDSVTLSILTGAATETFCEHALAVVLPIIRPVTWAIDLCNEPEGIIAGRCGNRTRSGLGWSEVRPALRLLRNCIAAHTPGIRVSVSSGWQIHEHVARGLYHRQGFEPDFFDFHLYTEDGAVPAGLALKLSRPVVLGELGGILEDRERSSRSAWNKAQEATARSLDALTGTRYEAAFLWFLSAPGEPDASALVYAGEPGLALLRLQELVQAKLLRV